MLIQKEGGVYWRLIFSVFSIICNSFWIWVACVRIRIFKDLKVYKRQEGGSSNKAYSVLLAKFLDVKVEKYTILYRFLHVFVFSLATCLEAGPVMDHHEGAIEHHHIDDRCPRKPDVRVDHHNLYIRRHRHAVVLQGIHARKVQT